LAHQRFTQERSVKNLEIGGRSRHRRAVFLRHMEQGPRVRREQILRDVPVDTGRLFAPVGIDLGADGPEQVAVSIVAELLAVNARRNGGHLRDRRGGIHDP